MPAQQLDPLIPWLMRKTGAKKFYLPSADYIWPHVMNKKVRRVVDAEGGRIVGEEYYPLDHTEYGEDGREDHVQRGRGCVQYDRSARGRAILRAAPRRRLQNRGGQIICTYFDENLLSLVPAAHVEGLYGCLDYYQNVSDPFSKKLLGEYDERYPGKEQFTAGSACSGLYRGMKLWAAAVTEAGSLRQEEVIAALDHARIAEGPGGPAEMVPGQHHVRMNMYIAQAKNGRFKIVESLGAIDPKEAMVPSAAAFGP